MPALQGLYERITSVVDEVMAGFNEELDKSKSAFYSLCDTLSAVGAQVLDKYLELRRIKVVFLPQVGFLIKLDRRHHACNKSRMNSPIFLKLSFLSFSKVVMLILRMKICVN